MNELYDRLVYNLKHFEEWLTWALHDERILPVTNFVEKLILNSKVQTKKSKIEKQIKSREIKPIATTKPINNKATHKTQWNVKRPPDFTSAQSLTERQIREVQMKNAKARLIKSLENGTYMKLYNAFLVKMNRLQELLAITKNWLINLPNSTQIAMVTTLVLILGLIGMSVLGMVPTTLKVKDSLSSMISFRAKVPRIWSTKADTVWNIKNFVYPTDSFVNSIYQKGTITFVYRSPKIYVEILNAPTITHIEGQQNQSLNFEMKRFMTAERFIDNYIRRDNIGANEIKIYAKDIMDAKIIDTLKLKQKEQQGSNPYIMPAIVTYSYVQNGARYRQMVMTVVSSIDKEARALNNQQQIELVSYRLWKVHFLLSYKARLNPYEKYLPVFNRFAQSIQYNNNWLNGVNGTIAELETAEQTQKKASIPTDILVRNGPGQNQMPMADFNASQYQDIARRAMTRFRTASRNPVYGAYGIEEPYRTILNDFALNSILYQYDDYGTTIRMPLKYEFVYRNKNTGDVVGTNDSSYKPSPEYIKLRKKGN